MIISTLFLTSKIWGVTQWARGFDYMLNVPKNVPNVYLMYLKV